MNAEYKKVQVEILRDGQKRICYLHVVTPVGKETLYFLIDMFNWAVEDTNQIKAAVLCYKTGMFTEVE